MKECIGSMKRTTHIIAPEKGFAKTVLMPGDPLRAKYIAERYFENASLINEVRGALAFTGDFRGKKISVMASGMGMPSIGIYSHELYESFGVENIIRIGTAGGISEDVKVRDIVIGMGACTDSNFGNKYGLPGAFAPICDYDLLRKCAEKAERNGLNYHVGNILSSDIFYSDPSMPSQSAQWGKMNVLAVEMEAAALYMEAARLSDKDRKCRALALCTVSNHLITGEEIPAPERERQLNDMIELALDTAFEL